MSKQTVEDVHIEITFRENAGDMNAVEMLRAYATLLAEKEKDRNEQSEYICTCGISVTPHRCPTNNGF